MIWGGHKGADRLLLLLLSLISPASLKVGDGHEQRKEYKEVSSGRVRGVSLSPSLSVSLSEATATSFHTQAHVPGAVQVLKTRRKKEGAGEQKSVRVSVCVCERE